MKTRIRASAVGAMDEIMTPDQAAAYLKITKGSLYHRVSRGEIPYISMGRLLRFWRSELEKYLRRCSYDGTDAA